ncbi:MAG TPA: histidinol-phosphate transaminase [Acidisarcina sp.]
MLELNELQANAESGTAPAPRQAVLDMKEYHPPLGSRDGLRLDFNENTLQCSPRVLEALRNITAAELTRYPQREPLESLVAEHLQLDPAQVLLTNGVDEAIHVLCETYLDEADEILFSVPTYSMYEVYASGAGARLKMIDAGKDFAFPFEQMLEAITAKTKLIFIANPNSPTGSTASREQLIQIAKRAPHAAVLVDEAYFHFFGETVMDQVGRIPNLLVARTFSKAYGLAGLRLGVLAAHADSMHWLRRVISPYSVNSLALACLRPALNDEIYLRWYVDQVLAARTEFAEALDLLGVRYWSSKANFILVKIGAKHKEFVEAMRSSNVLVRDRSSDPGCGGCVRVTIGTREQMADAIPVLKQSLLEIGWTRDA